MAHSWEWIFDAFNAAQVSFQSLYPNQWKYKQSGFTGFIPATRAARISSYQPQDSGLKSNHEPE